MYLTMRQDWSKGRGCRALFFVALFLLMPTPHLGYAKIVSGLVSYEYILRPQPIKRTSSSHVGSVMALLATFESSGTLPPENSTEATKIVQSVIQFQSAFMKSSHPAVVQFLEEACQAKFPSESRARILTFRENGWTSEILEALVEYDVKRNLWTPSLNEGMRPFNMTQEDFRLLVKTFLNAKRGLTQQHKDIHHIFDQWRGRMPGGKKDRESSLP